MALTGPAVMMLFYDIDGDTSDHDDWHSYEHFHERLGVPGFRRATRWVARDATPRYMVSYEVDSVDVATSRAYLDRLNDPTPWTSAMMPRFRGMTRGFCDIVSSAGFGLGHAAAVIRFHPADGHGNTLATWLSRDILPALAARRGLVAAQLLQPAPPPPMTREQALRGKDAPMPWLVLVTAYDPAALDTALTDLLGQDAFHRHGATGAWSVGGYTLHHTAIADEVARTPMPPQLGPSGRKVVTDLPPPSD